MKYRIISVITVASALALCFFLGGGQPGLALAAGAGDTGVTPKTIVQEYSADMKLTSTDPHSFTGDVRVDSGVTLDLNGQQLTITGNLEVLGTLHINNGSLVVKSGSIAIDGGLLQMTNDNTTTSLTNPNTVTVSGSFTANGKDETSALTAGTITVKGNFIQYKNNSAKSFCPAGTKVVITGSGRLVSFDSPATSWIAAHDFTGATFNSMSVFSFNLNLSDAATDLSTLIPGTIAEGQMNIQGQMNGKKLTVPANTVIAGPLTLGGGQLTANGALTVEDSGGITMANANDNITVGGNFITKGICSCSAGTVQINGNFSQYGVVKGFHDNSWVCSPANITKITGTNRVVNFDSPDTSCFGQLDTTNATITTGSTLSLNCDLSADTTLSYTVASIYYGGHLNGHKLTVPNSPFFAARQIVLGSGTLDVTKNFTASADNSLIMTNANDHVIARADLITSGKMDATSITAGKFDLYGNFTQTGNPASFIASGSNVVTLYGANTTVQFINPGQSWFCKLALASGASLNPASVLSMKYDMEASQAYAVQALYYGGSLGGNNLTVNGNLHIIGNTDIGSGTLKATGSVTLDGALTMANSSGKLEAGGAFSGAGTAALIAGSAEFKGGFHYSGTSYAASGSHSTILSGGANMAVIFDHPDKSYFAAVSLTSGTTLSSASVLSVKTTGLADMSFNVPRLYLQGDLAGKAVTLTGSLTVPSGATLNINGGALNATGDMVLDGTLIMMKAADIVTVGGSFTAEGPDESNDLINGKLTIKGNFTQRKTVSDNSFVCAATHKTLLSGTATQTIIFESANQSTFGTLYRINPSISCDIGFANCSLHNYVTSADLRTISGATGSLSPTVISPGVVKYIYVLPEGTNSAAFDVYPQDPSYATVVIGSTSYTTFPVPVSVVGVQPGDIKTVTITVKAKDDVVENTYTVNVEQLDDNLKAIGLTPGTLSFSQSFDPATLQYDVTLPASVESVTITPQAENSDSMFTIDGQAITSKTVTLKPGEKNTEIDVVVTSQNGTISKTYKVIASRDAILSGLGLSTGVLSPTFSSPLAIYAVSLSSLQDSVTITPTKKSDCTDLKIDGVEQSSSTYILKLGETKKATVTAYAGTVSFTYTLNISRSPIISGFYDQSQVKPGMLLSPTFDAEGDSGSGPFTLTVPASLANLTIQPPMGPECSSVSINGGGEFLDLDQSNLPPGGTIVLHIVAQAGGSGSPITRNFTLTVNKSPIITNLEPSEGTLTQKTDPTKHTFDPTVTEYYVDISATDGPVSIKPTVLSGTVTVNGQAWNPDDPVLLNPAPDATLVFTIVGTSGSGTSTYKINVARHKPVSGLTLSTGSLSPAFSASTGTYTVSLPITTASITITPVKTAQCTSLMINNVLQNSLTVTLPLGGTKDVQIEATETGIYGSTVSIYDVSIDRATLISDVDASSGTFSPAFDGSVLNYSLYLPSTTKSVTLTPQKTASCKSFTINGKAVTHLALAVPAGGMATATIQAVGNPSSITQKFTIKVYRIAPVTSMKLSSGTLSPAFSLGKTAYTVNVSASTASVTVTPGRASSCASLTIDGVNKASATLSPKIGCSVKTTITAIAVNGTKYTWTVTVNRKAMLSGITLSTGKLAPAYSVTTMNYAVSIPTSTSSVKVTPHRVSGVRSMTINGHSVSNITLKPAVGGSATATIVLTAGDGKTKQTYTVTVQRQPLLTGISPSAGTISPAFNPANLSYTVTLPADTSTTRLTFTKAATGVKSITVNNVSVTYVDVPVSQPGASATVKIVATATSGAATTYTVVVKRAPVISSITVTGGTLSPAFASGTASYTVSVPATTAKVTLKPVGTADCNYISINGAVASSMDFYPPVGGSVTATIVAKTALGATSTYTVKIVRAALVTAIKTSTSAYGISPAFSATTLNYTVNIPSSRSSITITAVKASKGVKSLTINGKAATSLLVKPPVGGSVVVVITATATNGITVTYKVTVNRAA